MLCSRQTNKTINKLHVRTLRLAYEDYNSMFITLLEKDRTLSTYHQNIQAEIAEISLGLTDNMDTANHNIRL